MSRTRAIARAALLVAALALPLGAAAQGFFMHLSGSPASIDCAANQVTLTGGNLTLSWNLPPANPVVTTTLSVNNVVVFTNTNPFSPTSGSQLIAGPSPTFGPVAFPYTAVAVAAPQAAGVGSVSYTVVCSAPGPASGFSVQNAIQVTAVPAVSTPTLALLGGLLAIAGAWALRSRRRSRT